VAELDPGTGERGAARPELRYDDACAIQRSRKRAPIATDGIERHRTGRIVVRTGRGAADAVRIDAGKDGERLSRLRFAGAVQRPSADPFAHRFAAEQTAGEPRDVVVEEDHVAMSAVERREAVLALRIVEVLRNLRASRGDRRDAERFVIVAQVLAVGVVEA